jgi:hypothetical protein
MLGEWLVLFHGWGRAPGYSGELKFAEGEQSLPAPAGVPARQAGVPAPRHS